MKRQNLVGGALFLVLAGVLSKLLGAIYRLPLTNILGAEGIGIYQLVFPIYAFLLLVVCGGLPLAESKAIAQSANGDEQKRVFKWTLLAMTILGAALSLFLLALSPLFAKMVGQEKCLWGFVCISPSIFVCAIMGAIRGYFQGERNMIPTATSQVVEQFVKLVVGIAFAWWLSAKGVVWGVVGAITGIVASELVALVVISLFYFSTKKKFLQTGPSSNITKRQFFKMAVLFTASACALPFASCLDSFLTINLLQIGGMSTMAATEMYGLLSGVVLTLTSLPCVFSQALATAIIPNLSRNREGGQDSLAIRYICVVAIPCALAFCIFAPNIISLLYPKIASQPILFNTSCKLLAISSLNVIFVSLTSVCVSIFQANGRLVLPVFIYVGACVIKVILCAAFALFTPFGILGFAVSGVISNFCAFAFCFLKFKSFKSKMSCKDFSGVLLANVAIACFMFAAKALSLNGAYFALFVVVCVVVYFALCVAFGAVRKKDLLAVQRSSASKQLDA